jgi:hypothetical protein
MCSAHMENIEQASNLALIALVCKKQEK